MISVPLWLTAENPCSYRANRTSRSAVVYPDFKLNTALYSQLLEQGFRRSGDQVYKPYCDGCQACVPTRIPVRLFQANRKQKRCRKRNIQTTATIRPAEFDPRHFDLYQRYQAARHEKENDNPISKEDYIEFLGSRWCNTWFVEFRNNEDLMAIAVVDVLENSLSAVYTFFDPGFADHSPGVYAVLWQIEQAKNLKLDYVYLGFWIEDCRKMRYKIEYQPLEGLTGGQWQNLFSDHSN